MQSWLDTILQKPGSSPRPSTPTQATFSSPTAGDTVSELTAPGQTGLGPLAAPQPAPGLPRHGALLDGLVRAPYRPSELEMPHSVRLADRYQHRRQLVPDQLHALAARLQESEARNRELHAEFTRRLDLQLVIMQGIIDQRMDQKCRQQTNGGGSAPELRLAAMLGGEYLARAQEIVGHPTAPSNKQPSVPVSFGPPPAQRQSPQSAGRTKVVEWMPPRRDAGKEVSRGTRTSLPTQPEVGRSARRVASGVGKEEDTEMQDAMPTITWKPINPRTPVNKQDRQGPASDNNRELESDKEDSIWSRTDQPSAAASSPPASPTPGVTKPRYSVSRQTYHRHARGPPGRRFSYTRMPRTVIGIWDQWKHGADGNPAIEALERDYGTSWRTGSNREIKYGSNYVGTRHRIVQYVEMRAAREGVTPEDLCRRLDEHVDKRIQQLLAAIKRDEDPFVALEKR